MTLKNLIYISFFLLLANSCNKSIIEPEALTQEQPQSATLKSAVIGKKYYVAKTGRNSNSGTLLSPFLTIQKGLDVARAGDSVFVKVGIYKEYVKFMNSGTVGLPIVLKNYGSDIVLVDAQSTRIYCIYNNKKSNLVVAGINALNATAYNIFITEGENILIKNVTSTLPKNPTTSPMCIFLKSSTIWNKNITLQNCKTVGGHTGVYINEKNNLINIIGGDFSYAKVGGMAIGVTTDTLIAPHNVIVNGVYSHNNTWAGIGTRIAVNVTVRNCKSSYNGSTGIQIEAATYNTLLEDNLCEYNSQIYMYETGIWIFNSKNAIVRRNILRGNSTGLRVSKMTNFLAYNNLIIANTKSKNGSENTSGVDFSESSGSFYNNVLYGNCSANSKLGSIYVYPAGVSNIIIKNNIIMNDNSVKDMDFDLSAKSTVLSDYNMIFNANRAVNIQVGNTNYTWDVYKTATRQNAHSKNANPLFINSANSNFKLQSKSQAINAGSNVGLISDYLGKTNNGLPDIGAYEF